MNYPGEFSHIAAIDVATGKIRKLFELSTPALYYVCSLAYDDSSKTLFFTTNNSKGYRNLESYSIATGKTERLIEYSRTGDLAFNRADKTLWGIQHHNGYSSLVRIPPPYKDGQVIPIAAVRQGSLRHRHIAGRKAPDRHAREHQRRAAAHPHADRQPPRRRLRIRDTP